MPRKREYDDRPAAERPTEEVGYKKPPKSSQFKKGKSGNSVGPATPAKAIFVAAR